jgi:hypothetical protein
MPLTYANNYGGGAFTDAERDNTLANPVKGGFLLSASGAIRADAAGSYVITKSTGVAALTLAAPAIGTGDGIRIKVTSSTAEAHTITATGLFVDGASHVNVATFPSAGGGSIELLAYQGKWYVVCNNNVTMS